MYWSFVCLLVLASNVCLEAEIASNERDEQNIPVMTFSIKKRISTELFLDGNKGLYIYKRDIKKRIHKNR